MLFAPLWIIQLAAWNLSGSHCLVRDNRSSKRGDRQTPSRSLRHASLLRLQHEWLFCPLARHGKAIWQNAPHLIRQLVYERSGRPILMAWIWWKCSHPQVDLWAYLEQGPRKANPHNSPTLRKDWRSPRCPKPSFAVLDSLGVACWSFSSSSSRNKSEC